MTDEPREGPGDGPARPRVAGRLTGAHRGRRLGADARDRGRADRRAAAAPVPGPRCAHRRRADRLLPARRLRRQQQRRRHRPDRRLLLRDGLALDHRLRRRGAGDRVRAAVDDPRHHAPAAAVPHRPGRHHGRAAHRTVPSGVPHQPLEVPRAQPRRGRGLRDEGPGRGHHAARGRARRRPHRRRRHRPRTARRGVRARAGDRARRRDPVVGAAHGRAAARDGPGRRHQPRRHGRAWSP